MAKEAVEKEIARGWDESEKAADSGGLFMKWEDKQVHAFNVCSEPVFFEKDWNDGKGPKRRAKVDVYIPGEGIKVWEMSSTVFRDLADERKEAREPFGDALIAVKRVGSGTDTVYKIRAQRQLTAAEIKDRDAALASKVSSGGGAAMAPADDPF